MAKLPKITRIRREDLPDAPGWIEKLLYPLNLFMEGVYQALNQNLTYAENLASKVVAFEFTTPAAYGRPRVAARYTSDAQNSYGATDTVVDYEDADYDTHGAVTTGASWKFTAPAAGYYMISGAVGFESASYSAGDLVWLMLYKNGSALSVLSFWRAQAAYTDFVYGAGAAVVYLDAGEYVDLRTQNERGSTQTRAASQYMNISIASIELAGQEADDFGSAVRFVNPLKTRPVGVYLVSLREKDDFNQAIYEATGLSWRINPEGAVEIGYIPGLKPSTRYEARVVVL